MKRSIRVTARGWSRRPSPLSPLALLGFALAVLSLAALLLAGPGSQWGWWHFRTGFSFLRWAAYGGVLAAVVSLAGAIHARPGGPRRGLILAMLGLLGGLTAFAVPWQWQRTARGVPPIHDITTDMNDPPGFVAILPLRADAPNRAEYGGPETAAHQAQAYPDIQPLRLEMPPRQAFDRALGTARRMGWEIVAADTAAGRIEATDRTFWFGFADDVVIRITPVGMGSRVDVRSVSRIGRGDVGTNARRVRRFLERMQAQ